MPQTERTPDRPEQGQETPRSGLWNDDDVSPTTRQPRDQSRTPRDPAVRMRMRAIPPRPQSLRTPVEACCDEAGSRRRCSREPRAGPHTPQPATPPKFFPGDASQVQLRSLPFSHPTCFGVFNNPRQDRSEKGTPHANMLLRVVAEKEVMVPVPNLPSHFQFVILERILEGLFVAGLIVISCNPPVWQSDSPRPGASVGNADHNVPAPAVLGHRAEYHDGLTESRNAFTVHEGHRSTESKRPRLRRRKREADR